MPSSLTDSGGPPPQFFPSLFALPPRPSLTLVLNLHGTGSSLVHQSSTTPPRLFPPVSSVLPPSPPPPRRRGTLQPKTPTATCAVRPLRYRAWSAQSEVLADALEGAFDPEAATIERRPRPESPTHIDAPRATSRANVARNPLPWTDVPPRTMAIAMGWHKPDNVAGSSAPAIMVGLFVASGGLLFGYDTG